jgi:hypothetical protein
MTKITTADVSELRQKIAADAYAAHPGAAEQKLAYEDADYQDWCPEATDPRFGAMARAEAQSQADWDAAVERLIASPAYAAAVAEFGREAVRVRIAGWYEGSVEVAATLRAEEQFAADHEAVEFAEKAEAERQEAIAAAWSNVETLAQRASLPVDRSSIYGSTSRAECGEHPARWVESASMSDDGYRSDGEGGQYYAGVSQSAHSVRSSRVELRADWQARWDAAQASKETLVAFVAAFRDAVGITAAEQAAEEDRRRVAADAELQAAERNAVSAICDAARLPDTRGRSPATRRESSTRRADLAAGQAALAAVLAVKCPTALARESQEREAGKLREYIAGRVASAEQAERWESVVAKCDDASDDDIRALIASDWLWSSEVRVWQARLDRRAGDREDKARKEKSEQARNDFGRSAWGALAGLKL